jgi:predicted DNA-binding protein (UPF0251 family)
MVKIFKNAMNRRGEHSREALLRRLEGELDGIYDLIFQMFGLESLALRILERVLHRATALSKTERYERYLRLWALSVAVDGIRRAYPKFLSECTEDHEVPFASLTMEEKLLLFLHDRSELSYEEIAGITQIPIGRVGRCLTYAREKVARESLGLHWQGEETLALRERLAWNTSPSGADSTAPAAYLEAMGQARDFVASIPVRRFAEIESSIRSQKLLPLLGAPNAVRWQDLSWRYKLGFEASFIGALGLLAVIAMPWMLSRVNATAFVEGRFADVFQAAPPPLSTAQTAEITADRLLASSDSVEESGRAPEADEFADVEFPSGDTVETGTAPIAPSRQLATVYRLIVQSPSPQELIPHVRDLFAAKQVRERESSGRVMPGGVYFDGITSVGQYKQILFEMQKLGQTKTYSNGGSRNPQERARVIVWVQQI